MSLRPGLFITIEGIDGSGKSTQARLLAERLSGAGVEVVQTREPGGSPGAEEIRQLLVEGAPGRWSAETELLLFNAARRDHVERTIRPALDRGAWVLCDRFIDSTRCYQAAGRGAPRASVDALHGMCIGLDPDLTLILDLDPARASGRVAARASGEDRFEQFGPAFRTRLRQGFQDIAKAEPERCVLVDADGEAGMVAEQMWLAVAGRLAAVA